MDKLRIRDLTSEDYPVYDCWERQLHQLHVGARPDLFQPLEHPVPREQYLRELENDHEVRLLALVDEVPAGICSLSLRDAPASPLLRGEKSLYVVDLFVDSAFRKQGVAKALLAEGMKRGREFGATRMGLTVWPFNKAAIRFYENLGLTVRSLTLERNL
ncbi:MAG: GNAT family N-acetyltransferase [Acutalibacter sp.]